MTNAEPNTAAPMLPLCSGVPSLLPDTIRVKRTCRKLRRSYGALSSE